MKRLFRHCDPNAVALDFPMATLKLDLPDVLAAELDAAVAAGWFSTQAEAVEAAVREFVSHGRLSLQESQQLADIDWALDLAKKAK